MLKNFMEKNRGNMVFIIIATLLATTLFQGMPTTVNATVQAIYYINPVSGNDNNNGTSVSTAFKTIVKARDIVRDINSNMSGDIIVYLMNGTYNQMSTLSFGSLDSGTNGYNIYYKAYTGAAPVISGGKQITGWTLHDSGMNIYKANVDIGDNFRQLYVNGQRAIRAKGGPLPNVSFSSDNTYLTTTDKSYMNYSNQSEIELVSYREWAMQRALVSSITDNGSTAKFNMLAPYFQNMRTQHSHVYFDTPKWIENAYELINSEGEWYLNTTTHVLYYKPRTTENMSTSSVIAPIVEKLVEIKGTLDYRVQNIVFDGVAFSYATWLAPNQIGHSVIQANQQLPIGEASVGECIDTPANIIVDSASSIKFESCEFSHLGNAGLDLRYTQNSSVNMCRFFDISGTGIQVLGFVNDPNPSDARRICKNNSITRNTIHDVGVEYYSAVGIFVGYAENTTIKNNELYNLPYTGISVGWGWNAFSSTISKRNKISNNYIHDFMNALADGGGIYTLGPQPGSECKNNYILNMNTEIQGALYFDTGSAYYSVENNVLGNIPYWLWIWNSTIHDITITNTYTTTSNANNNGTNCMVSGTTLYSQENMPMAAQTIVNNAGINGAPGETNIALNKTVQASSVYNSVYTADKAVDGIADGKHGWSALIEDDSAWWQVDLGSAYNIKRIEIPARMGYDQYTTRRNFEIRASNDASMANYVVLGGVGSSGFPKDTTWTLNVSDPNSYRYLRLVKTDGAYMYIEEFRAFVETNLGLNKTAQASSIYNSSHTADKAVDGIVDGTHGWASSPAWWQVDLGSAYNIKRIEIPSRPVYDQIWSRRNFEIRASNDASMANYVVLGAFL